MIESVYLLRKYLKNNFVYQLPYICLNLRKLKKKDYDTSSGNASQDLSRNTILLNSFLTI